MLKPYFVHVILRYVVSSDRHGRAHIAAANDGASIRLALLSKFLFFPFRDTRNPSHVSVLSLCSSVCSYLTLSALRT